MQAVGEVSTGLDRCNIQQGICVWPTDIHEGRSISTAVARFRMDASTRAPLPLATGQSAISERSDLSRPKSSAVLHHPVT